MIYLRIFISIVVSTFLLSQCTFNSQPLGMGGGGSEAEAKTVAIVGSVVYSNGMVASGAKVTIRTGTTGSDSIFAQSTFTDDSGRYFIDSIIAGRYIVEIKDTLSNGVLIICSANSTDQILSLPKDTLRPFGFLKGVIYPISMGTKHVTVTLNYQGFFIRALQCDSIGAYAFNQLAPGVYDLTFTSPDTNYASLTLYSVGVKPGDTTNAGIHTLISTTALYKDPSYIADSTIVHSILVANGINAAVATITKVSQEYRITDLILNGKKISTLPTSICQLTKLKTLDLRYNRLTALPEQIGSLSSLQNLYLDGNELTQLPVSIGKLSNLITFRAAYNQLEAIPKEIGNLFSMTELFLDGNQLVQIPSEIGLLKSLVTLRLSCNHITTIPQEIGGCISLTTLTLDNNQLTVLPAQIGSCLSLAGIALHNNQLRELPIEFGNLKSLDICWLENNLLTSIPETFTTLTALRYLSVGHNRLSKLDGAVGTMLNLKQLRINDNLISFVDSRCLLNALLPVIDISNNQLCDVQTEVAQWLDKKDADWRNSQRCEQTDPTSDPIVITNPSTNSHLTVSETVPIRWNTSQAGLVAVLISFSPNNGKTWYLLNTSSPITASDPSWGNYIWTIPDSIDDGSSKVSTLSDSCKLKIYDYFGSQSGPQHTTYYEGVTNGSFTINMASTTPILKVITPNGGESYKISDTLRVGWEVDKSKVVAVKLYVSFDYGKRWVLLNGMGVIVNSTRFESYSWPIPPVIIDDDGTKISTVSRECMVKVQNYFSSESDQSDNKFVITP